MNKQLISIGKRLDGQARHSSRWRLAPALVCLVLLILAVIPSRVQGGAAEANTAPQAQVGTAPSAPLGTSFTYQGRLTDGGSPANGQYDFRFRLFDVPTGGSAIGTVDVGDQQVTDGLFTVQLDFGSDVFKGEARYLAIGVRPGDSTGAYTLLSPRQQLTPTPYALALPGLWTQQNGTSPNLIGGHSGNSVGTSVVGAAIGGGGNSILPNQVLGSYATVSGGANNTADNLYATVGGGYDNTASGSRATVGGGQNNTAGDNWATIGGGRDNIVSATYATVGGGYQNVVSTTYATVGGGYDNTAIGEGATIGGGYVNYAGGLYNTISGGRINQTGDDYSTVGGGYGNTVSGNYATISGGRYNDATEDFGTVGGGRGNVAGGIDAVVGGGNSNTATGDHTTISGGYTNYANNYYATVGGGYDNAATGSYATTPGGYDNSAAADFSFAAGRQARANHYGAFVWADDNAFDFASTGNRTFRARATGGVEFVLGIDGSGNPDWSCSVADGSWWSCSSDRNQKENLVPVDGADVLRQLEEMPIYTWNGKGQDPEVRHMGPTAQDFYTAYGLGEGDTHISTIDLDGVALAAVQELHTRNQALQAEVSSYKEENAALEARVDDLRRQNADFEARLAALEQGAVSPSPATGVPAWSLLGGLVVVAAVVVARYRGGPLLRKGGRR